MRIAKLLPLLLVAALALSTTTAHAQDEAKKKKSKQSSAQVDALPKSVIHVVTVVWKEGATPEQINAAIEGVKNLPKSFPGITRVWTRPIKLQNQRGAEKPLSHAFVMEFASEQALKDYAGSPAQLEWYKSYEPVRDRSTTHDITN
jgi:hypothetical protein